MQIGPSFRRGLRCGDRFPRRAGNQPRRQDRDRHRRLQRDRRGDREALRDEGVKVAVGARRVDRLEGDFTHELDVTDPGSAERFVAAAVEALGGLDILVNNAGGAIGRYPFWESSEDDEEWMIEANVHGLMRMTRLCLPHIRDGGHIVNMDSIAGRRRLRERGRLLRGQGRRRRCSARRCARICSAGRSAITDIAPGLAGGTEFSLVRFKGDEEKAAAVYKGVEPLTRRGHRRLHPLRADPPAARERRRDRRQGARPVERRPHPAGPVGLVALTILEGSTFCICDERGDIGEQTGGFFAEDTRFLSLFRLT